MKAFRFIQPCQKLGIQNGDTIIHSHHYSWFWFELPLRYVCLQHTYTVFPGKLEIAFRHATTTHINPAANFLPGMQKSTWRYALVFWNDGWNIITHCVAWVREDKRYAHIMNRRCRYSLFSIFFQNLLTQRVWVFKTGWILSSHFALGPFIYA